MEVKNEQLEVCRRYDADYYDAPSNFIVGITKNIKEKSLFPINGLRHNPDGETTGWYIWAGEYSEESDFFVPLHVEHIKEWRPEILKYLALPPGYRFLIGTNNYEDVWFDESLLQL